MFCMVYLCSYVLYVFVVGGDGASYVLYGLLVQLCTVCFLVQVMYCMVYLCSYVSYVFCVCVQAMYCMVYFVRLRIVLFTCAATYCVVYLYKYVFCCLFVQLCTVWFICTATYCAVKMNTCAQNTPELIADLQSQPEAFNATWCP